MNFRPHWKKFLTKISKFFDIYIFTSSTEKYANSIVNFLNEDHKFIKGILHRSHCLRTKNGFFIKDLRIIENVDMKKVVIVDNKIQSFSFQL
jgi:CTD small phosphatase-like protein 2